MTACRCVGSRAQPGRPAADHDDARAAVVTDRRHGKHVTLPTDARVHHARQIGVDPDPADAVLVAPEAAADPPSSERLRREFRVGDLPADHGDEIAVAVGEGPFRVVRFDQPADADDGDADGGSQCPGDR